MITTLTLRKCEQFLYKPCERSRVRQEKRRSALPHDVWESKAESIWIKSTRSKFRTDVKIMTITMIMMAGQRFQEMPVLPGLAESKQEPNVSPIWYRTAIRSRTTSDIVTSLLGILSVPADRVERGLGEQNVQTGRGYRMSRLLWVELLALVAEQEPLLTGFPLDQEAKHLD